MRTQPACDSAHAANKTNGASGWRRFMPATLSEREGGGKNGA
ncbi:hypothetical protein DB32_007071 [Sandaracinus amylolyticus]|uniref:Uncharacterized protein n=1 Tax=Sandaracinus amylolyticus TaxID=927083 RepID=A0A0F6YL43_9BACT|nr:hypothetical protein DB32_007071 [Sandaracinus amylolyticus]